jgi:hydrogenase expression/formation protein HypC
MCLAIPAEVLSLEADDHAVVSIGQVKKTISLALLDNVVVGDFVLLHVGFAIAKVDKEEAERTLRLFVETGMLAEELGDTVSQP